LFYRRVFAACKVRFLIPAFRRGLLLQYCLHSAHRPLAELVEKLDVHANQITDGTKQLLSNASDIFDKSAQQAETSAQTIEQFYARPGQLTVENDF